MPSTLFVCLLCSASYKPPATHFCVAECDRVSGIHRDFCEGCQEKQILLMTAQTLLPPKKEKKNGELHGED